MSRIRVTHLISGLSVGGAEMMLWRLLSRMDRARFESDVISLSDAGPVADRLRAIDIPVRALGMRQGRPSVGGFYRLTAALRHSRPDVLQTWLYHADIAGLVAGQTVGIPSIVWNIRASDMDMSHYKALSGLAVRACARWSHRPRAVVVNSEAGRRHHERLGYRPRRWELIPNGLDTSAFRPDARARREVRDEIGIPAECVVAGSVARFDPMKDQAGFLRAAAIVAGRTEGVHFVLAGKGVDWDNLVLRESAAAASLDGRVHLLGPRTDVPRLMAAFDIGVSSSAFGEGFPNVVAEAMASGVGCVTTDVGDARLIVADTGEVVAPSDPAAFAAAIERMVRLGPGGRADLGRAARARVVEHYDLPIAVTRYEQLYASLLEEQLCAA